MRYKIPFLRQGFFYFPAHICVPFGRPMTPSCCIDVAITQIDMRNSLTFEKLLELWITTLQADDKYCTVHLGKLVHRGQDRLGWSLRRRLEGRRCKREIRVGTQSDPAGFCEQAMIRKEKCLRLWNGTPTQLQTLRLDGEERLVVKPVPEAVRVIIVVIISTKDEEYNLGPIECEMSSEQQVLLIGTEPTNSEVIHRPGGDVRPKIFSESLPLLDIVTPNEGVA